MSSSRTQAFAQAQDLIENQAENLKFSVKTGDFDYWCHCASKLVELVIDLANRDKKYLHQDGISTCEDSLY